nr:SGNH/GDSL hydrolase family protein [Maliibacterium massiliense]
MQLAKRIEIFGDSLMKGVLLDSKSKRYHMLPKENIESFARAFALDIQNQSRFGCTITKGWQLLQRALGQEMHSDMVLLEYGGNDCDFDWKEVAAAPDAEHQPHTPLPLFVETYEAMIDALRARQLIPIVMSLPPIDAERYFAWITRGGLSQSAILRWLGDVQMIYRFHELYSNTATRIAREKNCLFVDVRPAFLQRRDYRTLMCEDGIHPNEQGHRVVAQTFARFAADYLGVPLAGV